MLREAKVGAFAVMAEDPKYVIITVGDSERVSRPSQSYQLKATCIAYAARVTYAYPRASEPALFAFSWGVSSPAEHRLERMLPQEGKEDSILVLIDGPIAQFQITSDARKLGGRIEKVELLVEVPESGATNH
jgi:hypothetical protein